MSSTNVFYKTPNAKRTIKVDWSEWLPSGVTISVSAWTALDSPTLTNNGAGIDSPAVSVTLTLSGGTAPGTYRWTNKITRSDGDIEERTIVIHVMSRKP